MTWAQVCFQGEQPRLNFVIDFTYNMEFADFHAFHGKQIARTYTSGTKGHQQLIGRMMTLEDWIPDPLMFTHVVSTPASERILTTMVSTAQEESMLEHAPADVQWPTVREGKLDGFMIIQAITDRAGQVRETSKHNSDNPGLEDYGREVALHYKFKPLLVDGAPQQMQMPLVLHFKTALGNPIPELDDKASRKLITGCSLPREIDDPKSSGRDVIIQFQVQDDGYLMTLGTLDHSLPVLGLFRLFHNCRYDIYKQNGVPIAYHANITVKAK